MKNTMFELIEKYDVITIFRHVSPDSDALGSQFGLKQWIMDTYPNKQVFALGYENSKSKENVYPCSDQTDDETIKKSLAIVLDTANAKRVDDSRFQSATHILKVDHHILVDSFADTEIVDDLAGATCEILSGMFMENGYKLSAACAQYLYGGLIADTLRFSIPTIKPHTLTIASYLVGCGVDVAKANADNFSTSLKQYRFENFIRSNCPVIEDTFAYMIVRREDYERFGLTFEEAKEKLFVMGGVHEFLAWALFTEKEKDEFGQPRFNGSLRSQHTQITDIAMKYHGGGHRYACGVKDLTLEDIDSLVTSLLNRVKEETEVK